MQTKEELGEAIASGIERALQEKYMSEEEFLTKLGRKPNLFSRFMYDVRKGNLTLQSVINIANALDVDVFDLLDKNRAKERWDLETLLAKGKKKFTAGEVVDLPKLLDFMWESLDFGERKRLGKEVYGQVMRGNYATHIRFHHKTSSNHAYYEIV